MFICEFVYFVLSYHPTLASQVLGLQTCDNLIWLSTMLFVTFKPLLSWYTKQNIISLQLPSTYLTQRPKANSFHTFRERTHVFLQFYSEVLLLPLNSDSSLSKPSMVVLGIFQSFSTPMPIDFSQQIIKIFYHLNFFSYNYISSCLIIIRVTEGPSFTVFL